MVYSSPSNKSKNNLTSSIEISKNSLLLLILLLYFCNSLCNIDSFNLGLFTFFANSNLNGVGVQVEEFASDNLSRGLLSVIPILRILDNDGLEKQ